MRSFTPAGAVKVQGTVFVVASLVLSTAKGLQVKTPVAILLVFAAIPVGFEDDGFKVGISLGRYVGAIDEGAIEGATVEGLNEGKDDEIALGVNVKEEVPVATPVTVKYPEQLTSLEHPCCKVKTWQFPPIKLVWIVEQRVELDASSLEVIKLFVVSYSLIN